MGGAGLAATAGGCGGVTGFGFGFTSASQCVSSLAQPSSVGSGGWASHGAAAGAGDAHVEVVVMAPLGRTFCSQARFSSFPVASQSAFLMAG